MTDHADETLAPLEQATRAFEERFGRPPRYAVAAPGRVNLIGEHTDYNDGFVLPMAIDRVTLIVAATRSDGGSSTRIASLNEDAVAEFPLDDTLAPGEPAWANYFKGAAAGCIAKGLTPPAFDALIHSTVPLGGGLSSSASLEVATATLFEAMTARVIDPTEKALLCQRAEHQFAGVPCGIMDQFIVTLAQPGKAMLLDCRSHQPRMVSMNDPELAVLIANSNVKHSLASGEYAKRRAECEAAAAALGVKALRDADFNALVAKKHDLDPVIFKRAYHVVNEIHRTERAAEHLEQGDWEGFGRLMDDSHASLRDHYEVSCKELDLLVEMAQRFTGKGVYGARMTGGGFGGCTVTLLKRDAVDEVTAFITEHYPKHTGFAPTLFATRPAAGARILSAGRLPE